MLSQEMEDFGHFEQQNNDQLHDIGERVSKMVRFAIPLLSFLLGFTITLAFLAMFRRLPWVV